MEKLYNHHRNNYPESDEDEQEEEDYRSNDRYKGGVIVLIIDILPTITADRLNPGARHVINTVTKKAPRRNGAKSLTRNIARSLITIGDFSKHRKRNPHLGKPPQL